MEDILTEVTSVLKLHKGTAQFLSKLCIVA